MKKVKRELIKSLSMGMLIGAVAFGAMAKPARKVSVKMTQPDGSVVTFVKLGDERGHGLFTTDMHMVVKDARNRYVYATLDEAGNIVSSDVKVSDVEARTEQERKFVESLDAQAIHKVLDERRAQSLKGRIKTPAVPSALVGEVSATRGPGRTDYSFPVTGEQKAIVILVEFKDVKFGSKNKTKYATSGYDYFNEMLNKEGYRDEYGATGSAFDYFKLNSDGKFLPKFDVYGPVTLSQNMSYYGGNDSNGDDKNPHKMVEEACKALDATVNFKDYDRDGDGYVDNVYVFYAGYGEADTYGQEDTVWPHQYYLSWANSTNGITPGAMLKLDGVYIDKYGCSNETMGIDAYGSMMNRPDGIGTFVHEFSHVMGLPDLYCTDYSITPAPFTPGDYSVLDGGSYNNDGMTPPMYSGFERYALDWFAPESMERSGIYELEHLGYGGKSYILQTEVAREFYLFENRQKSGWDAYIPGHGMLVWHIDYLKSKFEGNEVNNSKVHQYVDLVEADNSQTDGSRTGDPFPGLKRVTSFGFKTTPSLKSWAGKDLTTEITDIAEANGKITFNLAHGGQSGVEEVGRVENGGEIYTLQGLKVGEVEDGTLPVLSKGVYLIKSGGKVRKVAL